MLNMEPWQYETTVLLASKDKAAREHEWVQVDLCVPSFQVKAPEREVRVMFKPSWNVWSEELPSQVWNVRTEGTWTYFSVAFLVSLPPFSEVRVGILYGNEEATPSALRRRFQVTERKDETLLDNTSLMLSIDNATGQWASMQLKYFRTGFLLPFDLNLGNGIQPGVEVLYPALEQGGECVRRSLASVAWKKREVLKGPLFFEQKNVHRLLDAKGENEVLEVETVVRLCADQPWVVCSQQVTVLDSVAVTGLRLAALSFPDPTFTHFSFRPTTPDFPSTELEEIGHIFIDKEHIAGLPEGSLFSDLLPLELPWTAFLGTRKNEYYSLNRVLLDWKCSLPTTDLYRPGTYVMREKGRVTSFLAPVYVGRAEKLSNATHLPKGARFELQYALAFLPFDDNRWKLAVDGLGARLNSPMKASSHPAVFKDGAWCSPAVQLLCGTRQNDYLKGGVR